MPIDITENFIRIRVAAPDKFEEFRILEKPGLAEKGIKAVNGKLKGQDKWEIQSWLFDKDKWDLERAKAWIESHGYTIQSEHLSADNQGLYKTLSEGGNFMRVNLWWDMTSLKKLEGDITVEEMEGIFARQEKRFYEKDWLIPIVLTHADTGDPDPIVGFIGLLRWADETNKDIVQGNVLSLREDIMGKIPQSEDDLFKPYRAQSISYYPTKRDEEGNVISEPDILHLGIVQVSAHRDVLQPIHLSEQINNKSIGGKVMEEEKKTLSEDIVKRGIEALEKEKKDLAQREKVIDDREEKLTKAEKKLAEDNAKVVKAQVELMQSEITARIKACQETGRMTADEGNRLTARLEKAFSEGVNDTLVAVVKEDLELAEKKKAGSVVTLTQFKPIEPPATSELIAELQGKGLSADQIERGIKMLKDLPAPGISSVIEKAKGGDK